jgi:hypothetical protein
LSVLVLKLWPKIIKHGLWIIPSRDTNEFIHKEAQPLEDELVKVGFTLTIKKLFYKKALKR